LLSLFVSYGLIKGLKEFKKYKSTNYFSQCLFSLGLNRTTHKPFDQFLELWVDSGSDF